MNVKELKEKLAGMPDDMPVVISYGMINPDGSLWHMTPSEPPEDPNCESICVCGAEFAGELDGDFVLIPTLLVNEISRRSFEDGDIDG